MQYVTIKDIARSLGVSVSTVSRAFNDKDDISKETREMILQKAKELGYNPSPIARNFLQNRTYNIGVVVPEFINAFFPEVIIGIQQVLLPQGYKLIIMQSNENADMEEYNLRFLEKIRVEGIIISLCRETRNIAFIRELIDKRIPIVLFNRVNESLEAPKVIFDDYKWALFATEHLIEQGYRRIFHFSGPKHLYLCQNRIKGYKQALKKHRLPFEENFVIETGFLIEDGERSMEQLIRSAHLPDAVFATNDPTAIGAMKVLKAYGYRIPEDVAVVGFTNCNLAEVIEPQLTSIAQPTFEMGKRTAELLLKQIESGGKQLPETITMEGELIIRRSSVKTDN